MQPRSVGSCAAGGRHVSIASPGEVAPSALLLPYCLGTMTYLEIAFAYLITFGLPVWLVIEQIVDERRLMRMAIAIRDERRRVAASREALARKALLTRRAS